MGKSIVTSYLKIALGILVFVLGMQVEAKPKIRTDVKFSSASVDSLNTTNDLPFYVIEFKSTVTADYVFNVKRGGTIQFYKDNSSLHWVSKTNALSYNFEHIVAPSLGVTEIIFPFHSFL